MIYLIGSASQGVCKIGFTESNVRARLSQLQTGCHFDLEVLGLLSGGKTDEAIVHSKFEQHHERGEWFAYRREIQDYFDNPPEGYERLESIIDSLSDTRMVNRLRLSTGSMLEFLKLKGGEMKVFMWSAMNCNMNDNTIILNVAIKKKLSREADIKFNSISNAISALVKANFLLRIGNSHYAINPTFCTRELVKNNGKPKLYELVNHID